ncbi:hypothetical protein [Micromonospora ureilytica]|uniref:hypothetical protein n=1 Tax=Micromonospora ureilytica TaxID=709868 RepID=UPI002E106FBC|nr:hypothetical protein OHB55_10260 [Micromonospora ureilytica]
MRSPAIETAPTSAPGRSAPLVAGRLRGLARRLVLIAAGVGAGFVVAALFQGPAAAEGVHGGSGAKLHREIGALVEPVARLTVADRPSHDRQRAAGAGDRRRDKLRAPLAEPIGGVVAPREKAPSTEPRRLTAASSPVNPPLPRAGASVPAGTAEREELRPASVARAAHRSAHRADLARPATDPPRQPATAGPPALHAPAASPAVGLITAPLPYVVDIVSTVPIRPVLVALLRVADAVLPPVLGPVTIPAATPPLPVPPALGPAAGPVTDPAPPPTVPTPSAEPALAPVPAAVPQTPAAPPPMSVVGPARATAPTGRLATHPGPLDAGGVFPGQPVTPADQDAAGVDNGSTPGSGLVQPLDRQAHFGAGQPCDLVPLLVESRTPSAIARPG